jgi:hypothetical protein
LLRNCKPGARRCRAFSINVNSREKGSMIKL